MIVFKFFNLGIILSLMFGANVNAQPISPAPIKMAVVGATHGHFSWIANRQGKKDINWVGIYEPNKELVNRLIERHKLSEHLFFDNLNQMLDQTKPEAVVAFGSIYEHMAVVEACAPRGIHIMVEKPLATNLEHALKMAELARDNGIILLTNYETSWYPTTEKTYQLVRENFIGEVRKVVVRMGHRGPKEIGVSKEFLSWLTDPVQNGGGALIDFGCYGANIMTYLMDGQKPISVTALTRQYKPEIYSKVDDDATIIVDYPQAQCIIQASWNWPFSRKDMEVYGKNGYIITENSSTMRMKNWDSSDESTIKVDADQMGIYVDPFAYFADAIRAGIQIPTHGLYSLENNIMVVRILDAARESARTGKTVNF
jgi:predicted dehydrogenase